MPFGYYARLSKREKAVYDRSDAVPSVPLAHASLLWPLRQALQAALEQDDRRAVEKASTLLARGITVMLQAAPVEVGVLAVRPALKAGELHGLYTREPGRRPLIRVWMRTLRQRRVVAFRTFLRTLLHEVCHHLDYAYLRLPESYHTHGFFKRESSLFHQLVSDAEAEGGAASVSYRK